MADTLFSCRYKPATDEHCCDRKARKASHCGSKQQYRPPDEMTLLWLVRATYKWVLFFAHIPFVVNRTFNATSTERLQQSNNNILVYFDCVGKSRDGQYSLPSLLRFVHGAWLATWRSRPESIPYFPGNQLRDWSRSVALLPARDSQRSMTRRSVTQRRQHRMKRHILIDSTDIDWWLRKLGCNPALVHSWLGSPGHRAEQVWVVLLFLVRPVARFKVSGREVHI